MNNYDLTMHNCRRQAQFVPDIPVQIAHLAGAGPGYDDPPAQQVMAVFAGAIERGDPRTDRLWFDVATVVDNNISPALADLVARRIRQVGIERILYGSDAAVGDNLRPHEGWAAFRRLPLGEDEFLRIARQDVGICLYQYLDSVRQRLQRLENQHISLGKLGLWVLAWY